MLKDSFFITPSIGYTIFIIVLFSLIIWLLPESHTVSFFILSIFVLLLILPYFSHVKIEKNEITIRAFPYVIKSVSFPSVKNAYIADITQEEHLRPILRYWGIYVPFTDYILGIVRLSNGATAYIASRGYKCLILEIDHKYIILRPNRFEEFIKVIAQNLPLQVS